MERLTEKTTPNPIHDCGYVAKVEEKGLLDKLGQLEDIEEELGIDLITVLNGLLDDGIVWVKLPYTHRLNGNLPNIYAVDVSIQTRWCFKRPRFFAIELGAFQFRFFLTDYGKTWALTKEELE